MGTCSLSCLQNAVSWVLLGDIQIQEVWAGAQESVVPVAPQGNLDGLAGLGATTSGMLSRRVGSSVLGSGGLSPLHRNHPFLQILGLIS